MPSLFQVKAAHLIWMILSSNPSLSDALLAAARQREAERKAQYVPPEEPNKTQWPLELKVVGNRLHDSAGQEVWLQGVNAGGLETLPHDRQMIKSVVVAIEDWKANCIRVPMNETFWYGKSPYQKDDGKEYREILDQIITLAANRGAYVVIDLHRYRAPRQEHADFWKDFATVYKNHPAVLFDLLNEPHGISWDVWKNGGFVANPDAVDETAFLTDEEKQKNRGFQSIGMQGLVDAVRSTGAETLSSPAESSGATICQGLFRDMLFRTKPATELCIRGTRTTGTPAGKTRCWPLQRNIRFWWGNWERT
ncbi:MAG: cellulase family glycosylhydrolase [Planctomycetaceae bacterium]